MKMSKNLKIRSIAYPGNVQTVSEKTWETMKVKGLASKFVVVEQTITPTDPPPEVEETLKKKKSSIN